MRTSCGIIPFKIEDGKIKYFLGHPGGRAWEFKDFWMFLKGGVEGEENWAEAAIREFKEETGLNPNDLTVDNLIPLGQVLQNPQKTVVAFGWRCKDINPTDCHSNLVEDGLTSEIDRFKWMTLDEVCSKTHTSHLVFYDQIDKMLKYDV